MLKNFCSSTYEYTDLGYIGVQPASAGCPSECIIKVCVHWVPGPSSSCPHPGPMGGCCLAYDTKCDPNCDVPPPPAPTATPVPDIPPSVSGSVNCTQGGDAGWCVGTSTLNMTASDLQGYTVTIQGTIGGTPFSCAPGNTCAKSLPEGSGNLTFWATSSAGSSSISSDSWKRDASDPLLSPNLPAVDGSNGWYISAILADLSASDSVSGIASTGISVDGGAVQRV